MKLKLFLFLLLAGVGYWAFNLKEKNTRLKKEIGILENKLSRVDCPDGLKTVPVYPADALGRIATYKDYLKSVNIENKTVGAVNRQTTVGPEGYDIPLDSIYEKNRKIEYFKIQVPCELSDLLDNADYPDSIFAVLSIQERFPDSTHREEGMIDLLFMLKTDSLSSNSVDSNGYMYYDFTRPCPPMCKDTTNLVNK